MHATDFLPILNTSRMLFCALANCTIRWDPTRSVAIMEFCCNPFFLQSCELYGSGATLWQTGKFLAWILGSELWASFMQCVILVRGFQWAKLTSANREWLYLPHSHKKNQFHTDLFLFPAMATLHPSTPFHSQGVCGMKFMDVHCTEKAPKWRRRRHIIIIYWVTQMASGLWWRRKLFHREM